MGLILQSGVIFPAVIPSNVDASKPATLTFELYTCVLFCQETQLISTQTAEAQIFAKGGWGTAIYDRERFSVADGSSSDFDTATLLAANTPIAGSSVYGVGYGIEGGKSTYPALRAIYGNEQFAVHDDVPDPMKPTGLLWAYVFGTRNGFPYHYWARLPELVTDVVSFCPGKDEDSYYRLPWKAGTPASVTQGNHGGFTHDGTEAYAFDLVMPKGTIGRAARGGRVDWIREGMSKNYFVEKFLNPSIEVGDVPANALKIEHQDGTWSWYFHMVPDGVIPDDEDIVKRGQKVIEVGNTGYSTDAHLHYQVNNPAGGTSIRIRFEAATFPAVSDPLPCQIPGEAGWTSTNTPGT